MSLYFFHADQEDRAGEVESGQRHQAARGVRAGEIHPADRARHDLPERVRVPPEDRARPVQPEAEGRWVVVWWLDGMDCIALHSIGKLCLI